MHTVTKPFSALIPGSFDPITLGHLDVIKRASELFCEVTVLVSHNDAKKYLLTPENRSALVRDAVKDLPNVRVDCFDGLLVDYIDTHGGNMVLVKGIRNDKDLAYENEMALYNRELAMRKYGYSVDTLYVPAGEMTSHISSTMVRTLLGSRVDVADLVPNAALLNSFLA